MTTLSAHDHATPHELSTSRPDASAPAAALPAFDHGRVSRFNAWFFRVFDRYINHVARRHKIGAFAGITSDEVVELGAGVGANLAYLREGTHLIAVEPSLQMHDELRRRAHEAGIDLTLLPHGAEELPLPDASVDEIICSLVLCTVEDPDRVLAEVRRVLRPGGRFRFVEHAAAPRWSPRRWLQRAIRRPWAWLYEGCTLDRDTAARLEVAGFGHVIVQPERFHRSAFYPVNSAIWGVATR
jgi:ubiquinone/menaquinone biosynthesis C-methylase UbiE